MGVTCKYEGCGKKVRARGWCDTHYRRVRRSGSPELRQVPIVKCNEKGCDKPHQARGKCSGHYKALLREEWAERPKVASTRQIRPIGENITAEPLVRYVESLGGLAAATAWMGTIHDTVVERWKRNYERTKDRGYLDVAVADEFCCRVLRIHPYFVWGDIWWDHEESDQQAAA